MFQFALCIPREVGQHAAVQDQADLRHGPCSQELMSLIHLHGPDQRQKKEYARTGGASFMGIINEIS